MTNVLACRWVFRGTLIGGILLAACQTGPAEPEPVASQIAHFGGDRQVGRVGSRLPMPFAVRVTNMGDRGVQGVGIHWQVTAGAGDLWSFPRLQPLIQSLTVTDSHGVAYVYFQPTVPGTSTVAASVAGLLHVAPVTFTIRASVPPEVVIRFGPLFDCTPFNDPSRFVGPGDSSDVMVQVGTIVEWVYMEWVDPSCEARITASSAPPGGELFSSEILRPGQHFQFTPNVAGTWEFGDVLNGGRGTLTAVEP